MVVSERKPYQADEFGENVEIDENVKAEFPAGSRILSVEPGGPGTWVQTARIEIELANEDTRVYFKKGKQGDDGRTMMASAFEAEVALHAVIPEHVPKPIAWGTYKAQPHVHFYLCDFVEMSDRLPNPRKWAEAVARLHTRSAGKSPEGKFGFHVSTHLGHVPVDNSWRNSWESFWSQQMKSLLDYEESIKGQSDEFSELKVAFFRKVIPRLLRPLEAGGRKIKPCLIHSNLWPGNIKHKAEGRDLCIFDSCAYWGHNEADLAVCRNPRYRLGKDYIDSYAQYMPEFPSHPADEFDDRNALYAMKFHVLLSILYRNEPRYRQIAMDEMRRLVKKFPTGYASYEEKAKDEVEIVESPTLLSVEPHVRDEEPRAHFVKHDLVEEERQHAAPPSGSSAESRAQEQRFRGEMNIPSAVLLALGVMGILIAYLLGVRVSLPE
uniref:protein-ribulosamine 3-kinase n=1 Tax=Coccidioides posadasii RMSCC 3488 TaxID=454284 RepID=A0A0J6F8N6_COCPO|nr:hypothetical protein CPAG_02896 [Coccidioides posadasii RMSCC 3488]